MNPPRELGDLVGVACAKEPKLNAHSRKARPANCCLERHWAAMCQKGDVDNDALAETARDLRFDEHAAERDVPARTLHTKEKLVGLGRKLDRSSERHANEAASSP